MLDPTIKPDPKVHKNQDITRRCPYCNPVRKPPQVDPGWIKRMQAQQVREINRQSKIKDNLHRDLLNKAFDIEDY